MGICILLFAAYFMYLLVEKHMNEKYLRSFTAIIHVSGIRGKTSVCRLLDSALREKYRVFTKTTGSQPCIINAEGVELPLRRLGPANIREQMRTVRKAHRAGAEVLILECMAVRPEFVEASQNLMLKAGICVITNVRYDHTAELGDTLEEIAQGLCSVVPYNGTLYTAERNMLPLIAAECEKKSSRLVPCEAESPEKTNRNIAAAIAADLGVEPAQVEAGFAKVQVDFGAANLYPLQNTEGEQIGFLNLFSVNDPQSTMEQLERFAKPDVPVVFLFNNRWDRPDRAALFAKRFFPAYPGCRVLLLGGSAPLLRRLFGKTPGVSCEPVKFWQSSLAVPKGTLLVGLGNIKGQAYDMLEALERGEQKWQKPC